MRIYFIGLMIVLFCSPPTPIYAQSNDATELHEVELAIRQFFTAMYHADSARLRELFHPEARVQTVAANKTGDISLQSTPIAALIQSVGQSPAKALDEQIGSIEIRIDGALATAWTPYKFYYQGNYSHSGVNAFQLVRTAKGWRIHQITDTRRK